MTDTIPYDELRRILGLPDVRAEVQRQRAELAWRQFGVAISEFVEAVKPVMARFAEQLTEAVQQQRHRPPMWAIDPAHSRRPKST